LIQNNLYFRNISRRWKKEAVCTNSLIFFSPYITSSTAETVLLDNEYLSCQIYTVFKAENFACRASSLKTLKKLINSGCELFHIDDLHAKVMLSDDFISIGSQNLTNKGKSNLEASFCSDNPNFIKYSHSKIEKWIRFAKEITLEMIENMEKEVTPLIIEYDKLKKLFQLSDDVISEKENIRQELEKNRVKKILEDKERLRQLVNNATNVVQSNRTVFARVRNTSTHGYTYSLVPVAKTASFIHWQIQGKIKALDSKKRYLFIDLENGRFGWARVNKTQITYFSDGVSRGEETAIGSWRCKLSFDTNWSDPQSDQNLTITIRYLNTNIKLVYECHFDLKFLTNHSLNTKDSQNLKGAEEIILWNETHFEEFSNSIAHHIFSPFFYNRKLLGEQANVFFIDRWRSKQISLGIINGFPILLSKPN